MEVIKVGIGVIIRKDDMILLGHRKEDYKDTGGIFEPDSWCLPGGKQEYDETIFECAFREVREECNLSISDLEVFGAMDDIEPNKHFVTIWVVANGYSGEVKVMEEDKIDEWRWFYLDDLPSNIYSPSRKFIESFINRK